MGRRKQKKKDKQLFKGQQTYGQSIITSVNQKTGVVTIGGGGGYCTTTANGCTTDQQLVADFNRHLQPKPAPQPCPTLVEGDEVELLIDDPEGYGFFNQPKFKAGDKVKIFSVSKDRIVATCLGGVIELDPAKYGATFKYEAPNLAPKLYSEYADQKTEEYYDKYILD